MSENNEKPTSSAAAFDLDKLRDELECCICLNLYEEPRNLPCGHIYCESCVQVLISAANQPVPFIKCPKCREEVPVPANGQLPTAFAIKSLVAHFKQAEATHPNEVEVMGKCSACHKFVPCQESLLCVGCHDSFLAASATHKERSLDSLKMAKAETLRLQGYEACGRNAFVKAIQFYTQSIRECPGPICFTNRAQTNIKLGRFSLAYVDANEALKLDPRNEKARMLCVEALERMGMGQGGQEKQKVTDCANIGAEEAPNPSWPKNLQISDMFLVNRGYIEENLVGLVPEKVECEEARGKSMEIPLNHLDKFLNEHVEGGVHRIWFKFVKFTEPMVQMLRLIKPECFEDVDEDGEKDLNIHWFNCDFSRISQASFRFLLDELFCPAYIYIIDWIGMPADFNYNTLFKLKAFQNAKNIDYTEKIEPNSPNFNLHLNTDVLIDFLHSPGYRRLDLIDGQLQDGFDSFLDRLIQRFNKDTESRYYVLDVLMLNATDVTKERLEVGKTITLKHPKGKGKLKCTLTKAPRVHIPNHGSRNIALISRLLIAYSILRPLISSFMSPKCVNNPSKI